MAAPDPARPADHPPAAGTAPARLNLFLDSEPEVRHTAIPKGPALDGTPKQCYNAVTTTVGFLSVLEFFAVGKTFRALFWCAVKGGGNCQFLTYLQFSRF